VQHHFFPVTYPHTQVQLVPNRTRIESGEKREGKRKEREDTDVSEAVVKSREGGELNLGEGAAGGISGRITEMRKRRVGFFFLKII